MLKKQDLTHIAYGEQSLICYIIWIISDSCLEKSKMIRGKAVPRSMVTLHHYGMS